MCRPSQTPHLTTVEDEGTRLGFPLRGPDALNPRNVEIVKNLQAPSHPLSKITLKVVVFHRCFRSHLFYTHQVISQCRTRVKLNHLYRSQCLSNPLARVPLEPPLSAHLHKICVSSIYALQHTKLMATLVPLTPPEVHHLQLVRHLASPRSVSTRKGFPQSALVCVSASVFLWSREEKNEDINSIWK